MPVQSPALRTADTPVPLSQFCSGIRLSADARTLVRDEMEPLAYVRLLHEKALYADAIHVLARVFPKREGVWWACQCARQSLTRLSLPPKAEAAIAAAEAWVTAPGEDTRRPLFASSQSAGMDTASGLAAFAGFASEGSLAPPDFDPLPPEETLTSEMVAASVLMAGVAEPSEDSLERFRVFLEQGIGLYESITAKG
jgi:hypothetical protein